MVYTLIAKTKPRTFGLHLARLGTYPFGSPWGPFGHPWSFQWLFLGVHLVDLGVPLGPLAPRRLCGFLKTLKCFVGLPKCPK